MIEHSEAAHSTCGIEKSMLRCDVCNRAFVLTYRRANVTRSLSSSRVTSGWVRCPCAGCHRVQPVIVPFGSEVWVSEWLGSQGITPSEPTYRQVLESGHPRAARAPARPNPRRSAFGQRLSRWLSTLGARLLLR